MQRREFLKSAAVAGAAAVLPARSVATAEKSSVPVTATPDPYALGPDSRYQPGVPKGQLFRFSMDQSKYFPGTRRTIDVYVPAQYTGTEPACVWVAFDRLFDSLPAAFDNLIYKKEMPVTIAIGIHPGEIPSVNPPQNPRFNRSFEFDSMTDTMARFVLEEVFPAVEQHPSPAGQTIRLSEKPEDCAISGVSSGGIAAFTVAWHRPDRFHRVYTMIGTYVGMRGGDTYPVLVRKTEPKPLRVFIQDNDRDGWPGGLELGDWWMGNQEMERALTFAGYEVNRQWDQGTHDSRQGESILPDVLRWLWKDWPQPGTTGTTGNFAMKAIAKPGESWEAAVSKDLLTRTMMGYFANHQEIIGGIAGERQPEPDASHLSEFYAAPAVINDRSTMGAITSDHAGNIYAQNPSNGLILHIDNIGNVKIFAKVHPGNNGLAFGPDGKLYVAEIETAKVLTIGPAGKNTVIAEGIRGHRLTVTHGGSIYVTETGCSKWEDSARTGRVWLLRPNSSKILAADKLHGPAGISLSPDGLWLFVAEADGRHGYSYRVATDGTLSDGAPIYWFHVPGNASDCGALQVSMDTQGWAYTATRMGVQVFDRNGRVTAILPVGQNCQLAGICFGGVDFQTLYVSTGNTIYRRKVGTQGLPPGSTPITLPPWGAG